MPRRAAPPAQSATTRAATPARPCVINVQGTVKTLEQLRFQNRQQRGIKPRFRFGSVLPKNRGFGTDFDIRNNTRVVTKLELQKYYWAVSDKITSWLFNKGIYIIQYTYLGIIAPADWTTVIRIISVSAGVIIIFHHYQQFFCKLQSPIQHSCLWQGVSCSDKSHFIQVFGVTDCSLILC